MDDDVLEQCYRQYTDNLAAWIPEGVVEVNLSLLHQLNLLRYHSNVSDTPTLTRYFQVQESSEKITLVNEQFVVWIIPGIEHHNPLTYTLIALQTENGPHLETAFVTRGVYNSSKLVLRVLEKFLWEIQENQELLDKLTAASQ